MRIRKTTLNDLEPVMAMYDYARKFMQEHGNPNQWINGYPSEEYIRREIADGHSYICENEQGETVGTFCFIVGEPWRGTWTRGRTLQPSKRQIWTL